MIFFKNLSHGFFASTVNVSGIKIVDTKLHRFQNLRFCFFQINLSIFFRKTHAAKGKHGNRIFFFVISILHIHAPILLFLISVIRNRNFS